MNQLTDPNFELGTGWAYAGGASRVQVPAAHDGLWSGRLFARRSLLAGNVSSQITEDGILVVPGVPIPFSFRVNLDGLPDAPAFSPFTALWDADDGQGYQVVASLLKADLPAGWNEVALDPLVSVGASCALQFALGVPPFESSGFCQVDTITFGSEEELLMRSTAPTFMAKLKALVETIDPNIGKVHTTTKRWTSIAQLEQDGVLRITAAGLFDDVTRLGRNVTRFWWMQPKINCEPLTNGSAEYQTEILLTGFFQHEDGDGQVAALANAAIEILDAVNTKEAELTTLNTGDAYLGYLLSRPRMGEIQPTKIEDLGLVGSAVQITISFAEEVSYA